jgi:exodeoxyribonuclease-3
MGLKVFSPFCSENGCLLPIIRMAAIFVKNFWIRMKLLSWNVNGIRAAAKKGFLDWFLSTSPDVLGLQETKAMPDQIPDDLRQVEGYHAYWHSARRKGYSGVGVYTKTEPLGVEYGLGIDKFDLEGRVIILEFEAFFLYNIYYPNGQMNAERLRYKLDFYEAFQIHATERKNRGKGVIVCGDVNTAHKAIDLARPRENEKTSGFLPVEREWIDRFIESGFVDTFRMFNSDPGMYSWWNMRSRARERNVGWRIDYFFVNNEFSNNIQNAFILPDVMGSDHCPVGIELKLAQG